MSMQAKESEGGALSRLSLRAWCEESDLGPSRWFWIDDHCDEPMGPFDSHAEAMADFRDLREYSSPSGEPR